ncbi:MAG: hypothetical protein ACYDBB_13455 [Armatimonadota bacterium]
MADKTPRTEQESVFGLSQGIILATIFILGALIASQLQRSVGGNNLAWMISRTLPYDKTPHLGTALWLTEIALYGLLTYIISRRLWVAATGIVLGVIFRLVASFLIVMLVSHALNRTFGQTFQLIEGKLWVYRVMAMLMALSAILFPLCQMLKTGYGLYVEKKPKAKPKAAPNAGAFAFAAKQAPKQEYQIKRPKPQSASSGGDHFLTPPEGFTQPKPADLEGIVNIPVKVIYDSIPEAINVFEANQQIRIRLGYFVTQWKRATVWVTWQQVFPEGADNPNLRMLAGAETSHLRDRWIRIPARHFVVQVPRAHFNVEKKYPRWMRLAEVPQEQQFSLETPISS